MGQVVDPLRNLVSKGTATLRIDQCKPQVMMGIDVMAPRLLCQFGWIRQPAFGTATSADDGGTRSVQISLQIVN